ncbi:MAG: pseudaminic acid cytidylyltransferase [Lachnospiraceae bacterium]|nr:pseudaminic acid cytidylyltransferase [Lachnospiraceae bacterium]
MKKNLAVIVARGGSKRIPGKNIRDFCGKPIICYSIEAAIHSNIFDEIMVSTDDEEIKRIALEAGAKVPFMRSEKTSGDFAMTHEVLLEVIEEYRKRELEFDNMCCIYPTAPFVTAQKLKMGMEKLELESADTVLPVVAFSFPPQRGFVIQDRKIVFKYPENEFARSQDLELMYHDTGQFYCINVKRFLEKQKIVMENTYPLVIDEMEVQDIDNESDWKLAELKYKIFSEKA